MAQFEQKDWSGSLWVNDKKTEENHPDRTGKCMIDGVLMYVSGWLKRTKDGTPWLSLAFKPVDDHTKPQRTTNRNQSQELPEDLPF